MLYRSAIIRYVPVSIDQFRKLALGCPDAIEGEHQGHPDFRHSGRIFATIHPDGETVMVKLPPGTQAELIAASDAFRPASGAWGRAGSTLVDLSGVTLAVMRDAVTDAWQFAAAMTATQRAKK
tara:strand:+ start:116180 stop:116548 length:369 start_codon:yes stop_codon:yes gene_type:complete